MAISSTDRRQMDYYRAARDYTTRKFQDAGEGATMAEEQGYTMVVTPDMYQMFEGRPARQVGFKVEIWNAAGETVQTYTKQMTREIAQNVAAHWVLFGAK